MSHVYLICRRFGLRLDNVEECIIAKTNHSLKFYAKYRKNLKEKVSLLSSRKLFEWGEERGLPLSEIDEADFYGFLKELYEFLVRIIKNLNYES